MVKKEKKKILQYAPRRCKYLMLKDAIINTERSGLHPLQHMDNERRVVAV